MFLGIDVGTGGTRGPSSSTRAGKVLASTFRGARAHRLRRTSAGPSRTPRLVARRAGGNSRALLKDADSRPATGTEVRGSRSHRSDARLR